MLDSLISFSHIQNIIGIFSLTLLGYFASYNRKNIQWMTQIRLFLSLIVVTYFIIKVSIGAQILQSISNGFNSLYSAAEGGIQFLFGSLAQPTGSWGFIFAIKVLPIIIFFSAIISVLHYIGFLNWIVNIIGKFIKPFFGTKGPETLNAIANSFLGQTEAPLLIRGYLSTMSDSQLFAVMVAGMGTISAGIMGVYSSIGFSMQHLLAASIMSICSTLFMAKLWYPEQDLKLTKEEESLDREKKDGNALDALAKGACDGAMLAINIGAMLLVTISLLGYFDHIFFMIGGYLDSFLHTSWLAASLSLKSLFSLIGIPAAWIIGIPAERLHDAAHLIGLKVAVNEMVAYTKCIEYAFDERTKTIMTYALCGFSNFSCIGIQLGGIGILAPTVRPFIGRFGVRAVFAAACANLLNACVIGLFI